MIPNLRRENQNLKRFYKEVNFDNQPEEIKQKMNELLRFDNLCFEAIVKYCRDVNSLFCFNADVDQIIAEVDAQIEKEKKTGRHLYKIQRRQQRWNYGK